MADEAEALEEPDKASLYHATACSKSPDDASVWLRAGDFACRQCDYSKAFERYQEAASLEPSSSLVLMRCALAMFMEQRPEDANKFASLATTVAPEDALAWLLSCLLHGELGDVIMEDMCLNKAKTLQPDVAELFFEAGRVSVNLNLVSFAARCVNELHLRQHRPSSTAEIEARLALTNTPAEPERARAIADQALSQDYNNPNLWVILGEAHTVQKNDHEAQRCFAHAVALEQTADGHERVLLLLGHLYLKTEDFEEAKAVFLQACTRRASAYTWRGLGIACYRLSELAEAEDALAEANAYDNTLADVWGYLCLVAIRTGRRIEAQQCFKYMRRLVADQPSELLTEIRLEMQESNMALDEA